MDEILKNINKTEKWIEKNYPLFYIEIDSKFELNITWKEKLYLHLHKLKKPKCECGMYNNFINFNSGYRIYCSVKCLSNSKDVRDKIKKTNLSKYGNEVAMKSDYVKTNLINSISEKYGVNNVSILKSIKEKVKATNMEKYGVEYISQLDVNRKALSDRMKINSKNLNNNKKKSHFEYVSSKLSIYDIILLQIDNSTYECTHNGHIFKIHKNTLNDRIRLKCEICTECNKISHGSNSEHQLVEFIKKHNEIVLVHNRTILNGKELDVIIPEKKLAFEYNGLYWHSEEYKDRNYHFNKTNDCNNLGIKLFHVWEDDWLNKRSIIESMIINSLGKSNAIYARKCEISEVSIKESIEFINNNHLQGNVSSKVNIGLYYNGELVSLMTLGNLRIFMSHKSIDNHWELLRFCNKLNTRVIGGASRLFKYFIKNHNPEQVMSYSDRSWASGDLYIKLGFKYDLTSKPGYYYIIDGHRKHRFSFRKSELVKQGYNTNLSESEIMESRGIHKIFDSGQDRFIWSRISNL